MSAGVPGSPPRPPVRGWSSALKGGTVALKPAAVAPAIPGRTTKVIGSDAIASDTIVSGAPAAAAVPADTLAAAVPADTLAAAVPADTLAAAPPARPAAIDALGATLLGEASIAAGGAVTPAPAFAATLPGDDTVADPIGETMVANATHGELPTGLPSGATTSLARSTVLPRVEIVPGEGTRLVQFERPRYSELRTLGAGGMGEVALVRDEDIQRTVALKRLHAALESPHAIARFAEEVRTIGSLEHPGIVPVHDVGRDEAGRYFFVMKAVEGETLESIIEKILQKDPVYVARYSVEARLEIFVKLLHALAYAHEHGIVHRDLKPANVMVGRHGEVVLMDWGIAKKVGAPEIEPAPSAPVSAAPTHSKRFETAVGTLIGTPAYMSPEQASGHNDRIDVRSDLYSACVLLYELLALRHPLDGKTTLDEVFHSVRVEEPSFMDMVAHMPAEWAHYLAKGLRKDPAERFQSAQEMIDRIQATLEGHVPVQCHVTATKRMTRELGRFVDRKKHLAFATVFFGLLLALYGLGAIVMRVFA